MKLLKNIKLKDNTKKLNKTDWIIMGVMVLVYGILSFIRLGDTKVPNTYKTFASEDESIIVTLKEESSFDKIRYYTGNNLGKIDISTSVDGEEYNSLTNLDIGSVFTWQDVYVNAQAKYIKFTSMQMNSTLGDIALYRGNDIVPIIVEEDNPLTDEINLVPDNISFMNSTYFDEIYYARSAYEYANGLDAYEWSHPPLGKIIITLPVAIFGFSPFTYRLMGNLFGIMMIPLMYILAKKIFKSRKWALLAGLIMMFDTFHFAHTRICLVDGFQIFFILLSVLFMKNYMDLEKDSPFKKKALYLILSGTFIGCAISTKWNAAYVAIGLAVTFFVHLLMQYNVKPIKFLKEKLSINNIFRCVIFLVIIPVSVYYLSFLLISKKVASFLLTVYYVGLGIFILMILAIHFNKVKAVIKSFFKHIIKPFKDKYLIKLFITCVIGFIIMPVVIYALSYLLFPNLSYYDGTLKGIIDTNKMMYDYHANLVATHPFSSVWYEWPIMANPVWFYSGSVDNLRMTITDIGNPAIWWFGIASFVYLVISSIVKKDKNNIFLLIFILTSSVPYVFISRLMFMYHYFITLPFVMLGIVSFIKWITERIKNDKVYYGYIAIIIVMFIIFYPVVSATPVSDSYINSLKWLSHWFF